MRAPGNVNQHALMEILMEHAAAQTGLSPDQIRMKNLIKRGDPVMPPGTTLGRTETEAEIKILILSFQLRPVLCPR